MQLGQVPRDRSTSPRTARSLATLAWMEIDFGDWTRAEQTAHRALDAAAEHGQAHIHARAAGALAFLHGQRGEVRRAGELLAAVERIAVPTRARDLLADAQLVRGQLALATGDHELALAHLSRLFDPDDPAGEPDRARAAGFDLVEATVLTRGDVTGALRQVEAAVAARGPAPRRHVPAAAIQALVASDAEVDAAVGRALAGARDASPMLRARLRLVLGRRTAARVPLILAVEEFTALGATAWARRAQAELRRSGADHGSAAVCAMLPVRFPVAGAGNRPHNAGRAA